jgi:hypothetical protein
LRAGTVIAAPLKPGDAKNGQTLELQTCLPKFETRIWYATLPRFLLSIMRATVSSNLP